MTQYIDKSALVAEIERRKNKNQQICTAEGSGAFYEDGFIIDIINSIDTIEVKESLTWEDIRELYIIFAEIDVEIELCKVDVKSETIGYYQEVLRRFKAQKGE